MNSLALAFVAVTAAAVLVLPRRWALCPLMAGACYMTLGQGISVGPFTFTVVRLLVLAGVVRVVVRRERLPGGMNSLDWLMLSWATWVCCSAWFHTDPETGIVFRLGLAYNACGFYFLMRTFCASRRDSINVCRITAILLIPVAAEMFYEHVAVHNLFSVFGGVSETPQIREGHIRASGPFAHPILAGTVGAVSLPLAIALWRFHRITAIAGTLACVSIVLNSRSSGPFVSAAVAILALLMWPERYRMRAFRWSAVAFYILLDLVMKAPAYYLIARIDVAGGSTGWHRARLIETAIDHLSEWWLVGTDYTRHWMPTGVSWNLAHTDITNYYLQMGIWGGLLLLLLFVAAISRGFWFIGNKLIDERHRPSRDGFIVWAFGAALFAQVATCISVSYFDQSVFFLYSTLAGIASIRATNHIEKAEEMPPDRVKAAPAHFIRASWGDNGGLGTTQLTRHQ